MNFLLMEWLHQDMNGVDFSSPKCNFQYDPYYAEIIWYTSKWLNDDNAFSNELLLSMFLF